MRKKNNIHINADISYKKVPYKSIIWYTLVANEEGDKIPKRNTKKYYQEDTVDTLKTLHRMYKSSGRTHQYFVQGLFIILLGILSAVSSMVLGFLTQGIVELTMENIFFYFTVFLIASLAAALLNWVSSRCLIVMVEKIRTTYRCMTAKALLKAEYGHVQGMQSGDLISRVNSDAESAGYGSELLITALKNITIPLILFIVILILDWRLALGFIVPFLFIYLFQKFSSKGYVGIMPFREAFAAMTAETQDIISNRTTLKAYGLQRKADEWADEKIEDFRRKGVRGIGLMYITTLPSLFVNCLPLLSCSGVGAVLVHSGALSIQGFVSASLLAQIATNELLNLPNVFVNMPSCLVAAGRLFEIWDIPEEQNGSNKTDSDRLVVSFENVSFQYNAGEEETLVLDDLSFSVKEGEKVALVGPSGCGKSTILKVITGLYRPEKGKVTLWGNALLDWDMEALRKRMGYMQQETFLFAGTIMENIACAVQDAGKDQIENAARKANLYDWIMEQPEGWNTPVGENGSLLSGGLKQRVGLARIFLQESRLLLLDEATSALDAQNEADVLTVLQSIGKEKTQISVAHRLAAIMDSDRILVLNQGKIVEEGRHAYLLSINGTYAALYREQKEGEDHDDAG